MLDDGNKNSGQVQLENANGKGSLNYEYVSKYCFSERPVTEEVITVCTLI